MLSLLQTQSPLLLAFFFGVSGLPWWLRWKRICQQTLVWSLSQEDPLEKGMATYSSILARRIPWTEEPGRLQSMGSQRVGHDWRTNTFKTKIPAPRTNVLAGREFLFSSLGWSGNAPEQRSEGSEGGESIPGWENSKCKGPEMGLAWHVWEMVRRMPCLEQGEPRGEGERWGQKEDVHRSHRTLWAAVKTWAFFVFWVRREP